MFGLYILPSGKTYQTTEIVPGLFLLVDGDDRKKAK